jgi:dGTPase
MKHEDKLVKGVFHKELLAEITPDKRDVVESIKRIDREKVYAAREVIEVEIPGFNVLGGLLDAFVVAPEDVSKNRKKPLSKSSILVKLIPDQFLGSRRIPHASPYQRLLNVTDFICGMTDSYAVALYKQISGLSL